MKALRLFGHLLAFVVLTVLTQVGGVIYLLNEWLFSFVQIEKLQHR